MSVDSSCLNVTYPKVAGGATFRYNEQMIIDIRGRLGAKQQ